jgi:hypothetical protein
MCGNKPKVDTSYQDFAREQAETARAEEEARQARIDDGLAQVKLIFEGSGAALPPRTIGKGGKQPIVERKGGMEPLLAAREEALRGFYLPQLDQKRDKAAEDLTFALSRAGLLNSSSAGEKQANLGEVYSLEKAGVLGDIQSDIAGTRTAMNQNRASIEAGLRASGDATAAANQALAAADTFRADSPKLSPLGDIFYGTAAGIGAARQGYDTGAVRRMMTPSPLRAGSGRNVRN